MVDPLPPARPTGLGPTLRFMAQSRKGIGAIVATIVASVYAAAMTISYFQGKLTPDQYWDKLQKPQAFIVGAWAIYMAAIAFEDGREKGRSSNVAVAEVSTDTDKTEKSTP